MLDPVSLPSRRRQYSSCDGCRSSRIGCDARHLAKSLNSNENPPCSNCKRRGFKCTFNYVCIAKQRKGRKDFLSLRESDSSSGSGGDSPPATSVDEVIYSSQIITNKSFLSPTSPLAKMNIQVESRNFKREMFNLYSLLLEGAFSIWFDPGCSPIVTLSCEAKDTPSAHNFLGRIRTLDSENSLVNGNDICLDDALSTCLQAYASQWVCRRDKNGNSASLLTKELWKKSREKVHSTMTVPSYRAIFALMLFGWTPVPKDCEENALEPMVSMDIALNHFNYLRPDKRITPDNSNHSTILWFGIVSDIGMACLLRRPTNLKFGTKDIWKTIDERDQIYATILNRDYKITSDFVLQMCRPASASKIHAWYQVNKLQVAVLVNNSSDEKVYKRLNNAWEQIRQFDETYLRFLLKCMQEYSNLIPSAQMNLVFLRCHDLFGKFLFIEVLENLAASRGGGINVFPKVDIDTFKAYCALNMVEIIKIVLSYPLSEKFLLQTSLPPQTTVFMLDPFAEFLCAPIMMTGKSLLSLIDMGFVPNMDLLDGVELCLTVLKGNRGHSLTVECMVEELTRAIEMTKASLVNNNPSPSMIPSPTITDSIFPSNSVPSLLSTETQPLHTTEVIKIESMGLCTPSTNFDLNLANSNTQLNHMGPPSTFMFLSPSTVFSFFDDNLSVKSGINAAVDGNIANSDYGVSAPVASFN